ncbi:MAG TPA: hypothetical protein EYP39_07990, partial [Ghiorsea sp.]|nr:hypothetical protein [Ghiorsea sp.]
PDEQTYLKEFFDRHVELDTYGNGKATIIGDGVFVGSDTKLVAPVQVGSGATIGAGSIITKQVQQDGLTLSARPEQRHVKNWIRPKKGSQ